MKAVKIIFGIISVAVAILATRENHMVWAVILMTSGLILLASARVIKFPRRWSRRKIEKYPTHRKWSEQIVPESGYERRVPCCKCLTSP